MASASLVALAVGAVVCTGARTGSEDRRAHRALHEACEERHGAHPVRLDRHEQEIAIKGYSDFTEVLRNQAGIEFKQAGGPGTVQLSQDARLRDERHPGRRRRREDQRAELGRRRQPADVLLLLLGSVQVLLNSICM